MRRQRARSEAAMGHGPAAKAKTDEAAEAAKSAEVAKAAEAEAEGSPAAMLQPAIIWGKSQGNLSTASSCRRGWYHEKRHARRGLGLRLAVGPLAWPWEGLASPGAGAGNFRERGWL